MKVLFFGIYDLGTLSLGRLLESGTEIAGIVTKAQEGPHLDMFREVARREGIPLFTPDPADPRALVSRVQSLRPDLIVVSGYHELISGEILNLANRGGINLHPSLLPKYRGPCPWKWVIVRGERTTGITVHQMDERFDSGPILAQEEVAIGENETGGELFRRLADQGSTLLARTIREMDRGRVQGRSQRHAESTYFKAPTPEEARIDWSMNPGIIRNLVRGLHPRPGAWTKIEGHRIGIRSVALLDWSSFRTPGTILGNSEEGLLVSTGESVLAVQVGHFEGVNADSMQALLQPGSIFEEPRTQASRRR